MDQDSCGMEFYTQCSVRASVIEFGIRSQENECNYIQKEREIEGE